jgi:hypothetical protein
MAHALDSAGTGIGNSYTVTQFTSPCIRESNRRRPLKRINPNHWYKIRKSNVQLRLFLISALNGGEWSNSQPGRFTPGRQPQYRFNRGLGEPHNRPERFWRRENLLPLPEFATRTVQPEASRYNIYAWHFSENKQNNVTYITTVNGLVTIWLFSWNSGFSFQGDSSTAISSANLANIPTTSHIAVCSLQYTRYDIRK